MRSMRPDAMQLGRLQELTDAALGHLELEQLLSALLERTRTLLDADTCAVLLLDHPNNELAHLELRELLTVLLPRIREVLGTDTCAVLLLDEEEKELVARAAVGLEEEVERGVRVPLGARFAGRVAATGRTAILDEVAEADIVNPILREKGIRSMLGVPLLVQGRAIGVLHVGTLTPR